MIQERGWWDVGRFSQLGLQWCVAAGSHTHRSACSIGQEACQQLARMLSWAWAAQMHTDASGSCLKFSRAESREGKRPLVKRSSHGSHTSSFLLTSTPWPRRFRLSLPAPQIVYTSKAGVPPPGSLLGLPQPPFSFPICFPSYKSNLPPLRVELLSGLWSGFLSLGS